MRPRAPPASSPEFTSDGADSIEGPARFVRETNSDGADTFLTRPNLLDEPLADALLLRVGRLEAVLERRRPRNAFVAVAVGECIIVACMLLFAWRDFGGC